MSNFYMTIGIPGSGKSTFVERFMQREKALGNEILRTCPDDIRKDLTGDASDQSKNGEVWALTYLFVREALETGRNIIVDATFVKARDRRKMLEHAELYGADATFALLIDTPLEVAKERNAKRDRVVPEDVLDRMHNQLNNPTVQDLVDEGFMVVMSLKDGLLAYNNELQRYDE